MLQKLNNVKLEGGGILRWIWAVKSGGKYDQNILHGYLTFSKLNKCIFFKKKKSTSDYKNESEMRLFCEVYRRNNENSRFSSSIEVAHLPDYLMGVLRRFSSWEFKKVYQRRGYFLNAETTT